MRSRAVKSLTLFFTGNEPEMKKVYVCLESLHYVYHDDKNYKVLLRTLEVGKFILSRFHKFVGNDYACHVGIKYLSH